MPLLRRKRDERLKSLPEISRFHGMVIRMYIDDHAWPHFHVWYQRQSVAVFDLRRMQLTDGQRNLPSSQRRRLHDWADENEGELLDNWERMERGERIARIRPLHESG